MTGSGGGVDARYNEVDNLILDIIGKDSPTARGMNVAESMEEQLVEEEFALDDAETGTIKPFLFYFSFLFLP